MKQKSFYVNLITRIFNEDTKDFTISSSSSLQTDKWSFTEEKDNESTSIVQGSYSSSEVNTGVAFSGIERLVAKRNAENEEHNLDALVSQLVYDMEKALLIFDAEGEALSTAEKKVIEIEKKYKMRILGEVLQEIYMHHFNNPSYLVGICKSLLRYDLDEVRPWGATMLPGLLNHPDERVKEATVQLIDNWADVELLPILKTLQVSSAWMRDYLDDVVEDLERINVLYQKAI